jgi:3'-5' exoribonuclease
MPSGRSTSEDPPQTVATMRPEELIDGVFACTRKERQMTRSGSPYLTLELRDSTGTITGRAFRDADLLAGRFERGELVRVAGRVERFREQLQIDVRTITRAEGEGADPTKFLPTAYRDLDELEGFLEHLVREVYDPGLRGLLEGVLGDRELRARIRLAPCSVPVPPGAGGRSSSAHHAYLGGLLEHTVAVASMALEMCVLHPRLNRDLLLSAAILHDLGKTGEFTYGAEIERSPEGAMLGHVEIGLRLIARYAPASLDPAVLLALEHCVIMHHGGEAAAGQRFASAEALALHRLNALDAQVKGAIEHGLAGSGR